MAEHGAPGVEKQQFENQDGGWVGVVVIDGKNEAVGKPVPPGGRVWLSEREKVLTAEAPQDPKHNPFLPQTRERINPETGDREDYTVTPLVPVSASRFVPSSDRYVPESAPDERLAEPAKGAVEEAATEEPPAPPQPAPPAPARAAAAVAGKLDGEAAPAPAPTPDPEPATLEGADAVEEETAAKVDPEVGEETGAAVPPSGEPAEGEYAQHEEVATPDAPGAAAQGPPAPWSPGSTG